MPWRPSQQLILCLDSLLLVAVVAPWVVCAVVVLAVRQGHCFHAHVTCSHISVEVSLVLVALIAVGVSCHRASSVADGSLIGLEHEIAASLQHSPQRRFKVCVCVCITTKGRR